MYSSSRKRNRPPHRGKVDAEVQEATPENLRIEIDQIFKEFMSNPDVREYIFPADLNNLQRKYVHEKAKTMNIISRSYGTEPNRKLHIKKKNHQVTCQSFYLILSTQSHYILHDYIKKYGDCGSILDGVKQLRLSEKVFGKLMEGAPVLVKCPIVTDEMREFKMRLPIYSVKDTVVQTIQTNQVTIISSETGSGKTTQIPQYILEDMWSKGKPCKIVCTQPRRIATVAIAERVADERSDSVGESVGYHIRLEQKYGLNTNLIYCTNGVMLRSLMSTETVLGNLTHIIIDEIHERDRLSDFLLICLKQSLNLYPNLKVILMSATVNIDKFKNYFGGAEVLSIPGRLFPITEYFLDEVLVDLQYMTPAMRSCATRENEFIAPPQIPAYDLEQHPHMDQALDDYIKCNGDYVQAAAQLGLYYLSENIPVDYQHSSTGLTALMVAAYHGDTHTMGQLCNMGANISLHCHKGKTALDYAFESSQYNAVQLLNYMKSIDTTCQPPPNSADLLTLYDKTVSDEELDYDLILALVCQIHSFEGYESILIFLPGYDEIMICNGKIEDSPLLRSSYKVFFLHGSMNIREQHEIFKKLPNRRKIILSTNIAETSITIDDVAYVIDCGKAKEKSYDAYNKLSSLTTQWISKACVKQRAGRAGRTSPGKCYHLFSRQRYSNMDEERVPEILRVSLEELCLHTKILAPQSMEIYSFLAQAPDPPSANAVKAAIESLQALGAMDLNESLTTLGEYLAQLTIEPRLGKMLIYSVIFQCLEPILTLAASLAHKDPFQLPAQANLRTRAAEKRKSLTEGVLSDHVIFLKAFKKWQDDACAGRGIEFCREFFVSKSTMDSILDTRRQLVGQLRAAGFLPQSDSIECFNVFAKSWPMVKAVMSTGLYPHVAFPINGNISTRNEKKVFIPNTSVLSKTNIPTWLLYDELVKNRQNFFIRGITAVTPITVALVCGNTTESTSANTLNIDEWLEFEANNDHEYILKFRYMISSLIQRTLANPLQNATSRDYSIVDTLNRILVAEDENASLVQPVGIGDRPRFLYKIVDDDSRAFNIRRVPPHERNGRRNILPEVSGGLQRNYFRPFSQRNQISPRNSQNYRSQPISRGLQNGRMHNTRNQQIERSHQEIRRRPNVQYDGHYTPSKVPCVALNPFILLLPDTNDAAQCSTSEEPPEEVIFPDLEEYMRLFEKKIRPFVFNTTLQGDELDTAEGIDIFKDRMYIIIRAGCSKNIEISVSNSRWVFAPHTEKKIISANDQGIAVYLLFTLAHGGPFKGVARFLNMIEDHQIGKPTASIAWLFCLNVDYDLTKQLRNPLNDDRPMCEGLDGQVVTNPVAEELVRIFYEKTVQESLQNRRAIHGKAE